MLLSQCPPEHRACEGNERPGSRTVENDSLLVKPCAWVENMKQDHPSPILDIDPQR